MILAYSQSILKSTSVRSGTKMAPFSFLAVFEKRNNFYQIVEEIAEAPPAEKTIPCPACDTLMKWVRQVAGGKK
jgi:hypothetical protein